MWLMRGHGAMRGLPSPRGLGFLFRPYVHVRCTRLIPRNGKMPGTAADFAILDIFLHRLTAGIDDEFRLFPAIGAGDVNGRVGNTVPERELLIEPVVVIARPNHDEHSTERSIWHAASSFFVIEEVSSATARCRKPSLVSRHRSRRFSSDIPHSDSGQRACREPVLVGLSRTWLCYRLTDIQFATMLPSMIEIPTLTATRYVQPLREGGSLPAIVDTTGGLFVVKFRGSGQGPKALIAELVVGLLAQATGFNVPELALVEIVPQFGRAEPDPEIQDLLRASHGVNVGLRYLDGSFNYDGFAAGSLVNPSLAARCVWLDAWLTNPDRTHHNPNLLVWERTPYLIDHGAALYAHHDWPGVDAARTRGVFPLIMNHVLLTHADDLTAADIEMTSLITTTLLRDVMNAVPDALLQDPVNKDSFADGSEARERYVRYLTERLEPPREFVQEAIRAQALRRTEPVQRKAARR